MSGETSKITALYERLSKDDLLLGESMSIQNQKLILEKYAAEHGFTNIRHFSDDGTSGTVFNRPGLNEMLAEVNAGNVAVVIIKDQSRIGRDVLEVGLLKRTFEEHEVRFIAANDNLDTARGFDIMSIFRDVFNEWFVADTSKKIRAVKRSNALQGKCSSKPPYGYRISGDNRVWEIDEEVADNVREIFRRVVGGESTCLIAKNFNERGLPTPSSHFLLAKGKTPPKELYWSSRTMDCMIVNPGYIGTFTALKRTTPSYKNHKIIERPKDEWVVIENHHPALIDTEIFEIVQRLCHNRRRITKRGDTGVLSGLIFCADCNSKLTIAYIRDWEYYICSRYRSATNYSANKCTRHSINRRDLEAIVLAKIRETVALAKEDAAKFAEQVYSATNRDAEKAIKTKSAELSKAERRIAELDRIIKRIYEDNINGKLSDERFSKLLTDYETEQSELSPAIVSLKSEIDELRGKSANLQSFMNLVENCSEITELTADVARTLIERIVVHEPVYKDGHKRAREHQEIHIFFTYIGEFNIG
jgi:DNA invertase Pin-like site-specific DNA recombinase